MGPQTPAPRARDWDALAVLTLAVLILTIDSTVLSPAIPSLSADLAPSATRLLWLRDIYSFALAGLLVTMGNIADRVGRRRLLLIGAVGSGLSSALAAVAPTQRVAPLAAEGYWSHTAAGAGTHSPGDPDTLELIVNLAAGRAPSDAGAQGSPSKPPGSTA